jgi:archaemetzincin
MKLKMTTIYFVAFGPVDRGLMRKVAEETGRILGLTVEIAPAALEIPKNAYDRRRDQHLSDAFLAELRRKRPVPRATVLGITQVDLYTPGLNFVFGQADMSERVAVISLCRLRPEFWGRPRNEPLLLERAVKEAVHELGHTFGLPHCPNPSCVMHFSNSLADTDRKGKVFCPSCECKLPARP